MIRCTKCNGNIIDVVWDKNSNTCDCACIKCNNKWILSREQIIGKEYNYR